MSSWGFWVNQAGWAYVYWSAITSRNPFMPWRKRSDKAA